MKLAVLLSGGKDSTYALYKMMKEGHEIKFLVTIFPKNIDSYMFHRPCIELTRLQAEAMGIPHITQTTEGEKEKELDDLKLALTKIKDQIDGVVTGAIASQYQKTRIDRLCEELGLKSFSPLWQQDPETLLREQAAVLETIFTAVASEGFDKNWIGKVLDEGAIKSLKSLNSSYGVHMSGEGGEFETLVLDAPMFKKKIKILESEGVWDKETSSGYMVAKRAVLVDK